MPTGGETATGGPGVTSPAPQDPVGTRYTVVASYELWRRMRYMLLYCTVVVLVGEGITVFGGAGLEPSYLVVAALFVVIGVALYLRKRLHYVELGNDGLLLRTPLKLRQLPYADIRQSRSQQMRAYFEAPNRRELFSGSLRRYGAQAICVIRVDTDHDLLLQLGRLMGRRTVLDQDLILVVQGADGLDRALHTRIRRRPPAPGARATRRR